MERWKLRVPNKKVRKTNKVNGIKERIRKAIVALLPPKETDLNKVKDEVWADLSRLYYKYEDEDQKHAFREVMQEISEKLSEGKWRTVYNRLYKKEKAGDTS